VCEEIAGKKVNIAFNDCTKNGNHSFFISSKKIYTQLGWKPMYSIDEAIHSAWKWHSNHPNGYGN